MPRPGLRQISLRTRLTLAIAVLCGLVVLLNTVALALLELPDQQNQITSEIKTFHDLLQNDLIELSLAGSPDKTAELVIKLGRFARLQSLWLYGPDDKGLFQYGNTDMQAPGNTRSLPASSPWRGDYWHRFPLLIDGRELGSAIYRTHYPSLAERLRENLFSSIWLVPFLLMLAWWWADQSASRFVRPIQKLLAAMDNTRSESGGITLATSDEIPEAERLFLGFNRLEERIRSSHSALQAELASKAYQAMHDKLTGLLNRQGFEDICERLLLGGKNPTHVFGYLDLDQFKLINDTVGHPAGDVYLRQLAGLLTAWCPPGATVARLGGDEFGLLLPATAREDAARLAQTLLDGIRGARFIWEGQPFQVGASVGLVAFTAGETTLTWLYQTADTACYTAKASGRDRYVWYEADDVSVREVHSDIVTMNRLHGALGQGPARFELWTQTIEPLKAEHADGQHRYEVLLRLRDADGRLVMPGEFLYAAERHGELVRIDSWVLWHYLEQVCRAPAHLAGLGFVDVNVTGVSLVHADFRATLERAIATFPFPWEKLTLEITESSAVRNFEQARSLIDYCKSHGIRFALDDFGTGMASFDYLKRLPFDTIKIDGSFIRSLIDDSMDQAVVEFIVRFADLRGQQTVAEFVESAAIAERLASLGVRFGQGYHLGHPRPLADWL
jgi:diguanylate cyclase (GGDEF)-like protein